MDARVVFEASRAAYARADVYGDRGTFQRVDVASGLVEAEGTFTTFFDRASDDFLIRRIKMPRLWLPDALRDAARRISGLSDAAPIDLDEQRLVIDYTLLP